MAALLFHFLCCAGHFFQFRPGGSVPDFLGTEVQELQVVFRSYPSQLWRRRGQGCANCFSVVAVVAVVGVWDVRCGPLATGNSFWWGVSCSVLAWGWMLVLHAGAGVRIADGGASMTWAWWCSTDVVRPESSADLRPSF